MKPSILMVTVAAGIWLVEASGYPVEAVRNPAVWTVSAGDPPTVVPADPRSEPVAFAASELRSYLKRILGASPPDAPNAPQRLAIRLSVRRDLGLSEEGYEFRAEGNTYWITGGSPLGVVYGVYEFLRRFGGCRFSDLGPDGEYVPCKGRFDADAGPLRIEPKLRYRGLQFSFYEDPELCRQRIDWMAKNGFNYLMYRPEPDDADPQSVVTVDLQSGEVRLPTQCNVYWPFSKGWFDKVLRPEVRKRGLKLDMNHHNLLYWLPPRRYLAEHPEWYAEIAGKRGAQWKQLCICTSNCAAVQTLIENVRNYLRENPEVKVVGVIPEDHMGMCQCRQCVAADPDPNDSLRKTDWASGNRSKSLRYAKLLNAVAAAIRQEFPDVTVGGEAYHDLLWPPRDVSIDSHTTVWLAVHMRDGCRPLAGEGTSETNRKIFEILKQWKSVYRGQLILYEYYMGMNAHRSLPYPMSEVICQDWTHLKQLGVQGATVQCWTTNHRAYALNNLAFARCGWSDDVNHAELLDDYLLGSFGSAGASLRPIFAGLVQATRELARGDSELRPTAGNIRFFLDKVGRDTIHRSLEAAQANARNERERRQVKKLSAAIDYWEQAAGLMHQWGEANRLAKPDPKAALAILDRLLDQQWPKFHTAMQWSQAPGWISITVPSQWDSTNLAAGKLRSRLRSTAPAPWTQPSLPLPSNGDPAKQIRFHTPTEADARRQQLIHWIWPGGLPASALPAVTKNIAFPSHLAGIDRPLAARVDLLDVDVLGMHGISYLIHPVNTTNVNRLVIVHQGHTSTAQESLSNGIGPTARRLLGEGYSVLLMQMPMNGWNPMQASVTPPGKATIAVSGTGTLGHNDMFRKLTPPILPNGEIFRFYLEPVVRGINHFRSVTPNCKDINMTGVSGGGWTTTMASAIDTRITLSVPVAGSGPFYCYNQGQWVVGDGEQSYPPLFNEDISTPDRGGGVTTYLEAYALGGYGEGRRQIMITNQYDSCCFRGTFVDSFQSIVVHLVKNDLQKGQWDYRLDTSHRRHEISSWALENVILPALRVSEP